MTRKKVKLVWIVNDAARKASLKKRRIGLCKKVSELTTLCGVNAFVIIYSPDEVEPVLWPSRPEVEEMLTRYQAIPEMERSKKMVNQESYLKERMGKIQDHVKKDSKKNREVEMSFLMHKLHLRGCDINALEVTERQCLVWLLEERMRDIRKRVDYFQQAPPLVPPGAFVASGQEQHIVPPPPLSSDPPPPPSPSPPPPSFEERVHGGGGEFRANPTDSMMWDQWFLEMVKNSDNVAGGSGSGSGSAPNVGCVAPPFPALPPRPQQGFGFGGSGSGFSSGVDVDSIAPPLPPPPQGFDFGGFSNGTDDVGALGLPFPSGEVNPFELGMAPPNSNPFEIGFPQGDFGGNSSSANPLGFGPTQPPPDGDIGCSNRTEEGLTEYFPSGSDVAELSWPPNISP